jgi:hypothetical protein
MSDSFHTFIAGDSLVGLGNEPCAIFSQMVLLPNVVFFDTSAIRRSLIFDSICTP